MTDYLPNAYATLARFYDDAGFSNYAGGISPEILTFLQKNDWIGRRVLILGVGTGVSAAALAERGMDIIGIDSSPEMLEIAQQRFQESVTHAEFMVGDIRTIEYPTDIDLVYSIGNVMNEMNGMRDLETVFQKAFHALLPERRIVFDMVSLRGMGEYLGSREQILDISNRLYITVQNRFNYESMSLRQTLTCFSSDAMGQWQRDNVYLTLRGFPHVAMVKLLEKVGFNVLGSYDLDLAPFNANEDKDGRFIIVGEKPA
jgi:SAM-dependent methyltransferase